VCEEVYAYVNALDFATDSGAVRESNEGHNTMGPVGCVAGAAPAGDKQLGVP
jgi:hypothetical protein